MIDSTAQLRRELRALKAYVVISTLVIGVTALSAFRKAAMPTKFDEIDVERINLREPDGKLRLVLSNRARSPGPIAHGKPFGYPGGSRPGIIFFNPGGHPKLPHSWPGQTPPPSGGGTDRS